MLYALTHLPSFLVLLASFVVGVTLHGWIQCLVADRTGDRRPRLERRLQPDPRRHVDPFGAVAVALSGLGWAKPVEPPARGRRGALVAVSLAGPAANLLLGAALLLVWHAWYADAGGFSSLVASVVSDGGGSELLTRGATLEEDAGGVVLLLAGTSQLYLGALSLVPLPPLDGSRLLFGLAPRTPGWQKAEHYLVEQNIGLVALLVLLVIPLAAGVPLLPYLLDGFLAPLVGVLTGV